MPSAPRRVGSPRQLRQVPSSAMIRRSSMPSRNGPISETRRRLDGRRQRRLWRQAKAGTHPSGRQLCRDTIGDDLPVHYRPNRRAPYAGPRRAKPRQWSARTEQTDDRQADNCAALTAWRTPWSCGRRSPIAGRPDRRRLPRHRRGRFAPSVRAGVGDLSPSRPRAAAYPHPRQARSARSSRRGPASPAYPQYRGSASSAGRCGRPA